MKKLMALCLAMLMALSMVSFTAMAEDAVDFAEIANGQPATFVTEDLVLGSHTIVSSDEDVISNDGTVTRSVAADKTVSISIDGGEAVSVTVKAKTANVIYKTDFSTDSTPVDLKFAEYPEWALGSAANDTVISGGKLYADHGVDGEDKGYVYIYAPTKASAVTTNPVSYSFKMSDLANVAVGVDLRISGTWYDETGAKLKDFSNITVARCNTLNGFAAYGFTSNVAASKNVTVKYDPTTGDFWFNGKRCETTSTGAGETYNLLGLLSWTKNNTTGVVTETRAPEGAASVKLTQFYFVDASSSAKGEYKIDDFVIYEDLAIEDVLVDATASEKAEYFAGYLSEEYIANGASLNNLKSNLKFEAEEDLSVYGMEIEWTSSDEEVITNDGKVLRDLYEVKTATVTGVLKVDGEEFAEVSYDVTVLPLSMASASEVLTADEGEDGDSVIGTTGWAKSLVLPYESVEIKEDETGKFYRFGSNNYQPNGSAPGYTFQTVPTMDGADKYIVEFKVRIPEKGGLANWTFALNNQEMAEFIYYNGYLYDNDYPLGNDDFHGAGSARSDVAVTAGMWYDLRMEIGKDSVVNCYINDKLVGSHTTAKAIPATITSAKLFFKGRYNCDTNNADATMIKYYFDLDDVKAYTTGSIDSAMEGLDDAAKVKYYKEYILAEGIVNDAESYLAVESDLNLLVPAAETGVSIQWSADSDAVASDGTVTRPDSPVSEKVNVTATITAGSAKEVITFPVRIAPAGTVKVPANFASMDFEPGTSRPSVSKATYVEDDTYGTSMNITMDEVKQVNQEIATSAMALTSVGYYDRYVINADLKYSRGEKSANTGSLVVKGIAGNESLAIRLNYATKTIQAATTSAVANGSATGVEKKTNNNLYFPMPEEIAAKEGEWISITIDHNVISQTYDIYADGIRINEAPILRAKVDVPNTESTVLRGLSLQLSQGGSLSLDNVTVRKYADKAMNEVHAALSVAAYLHASEDIYPTLISQDSLLTKTIDNSFIGKNVYVVDDSDPLGNLGRFTFTTAEDAPVISYKINGESATSIKVDDKTSYMTIEVTATKGDLTATRTMVRNTAPITVKNICYGGGYNGLWLQGDVKGTETILIAGYTDENKLVYIKKVQLTEENYDPATGLVKGFATPLPWSENSGYRKIRTFIYSDNGIEPATYEAARING